jgi:hypothetical protein
MMLKPVMMSNARQPFAQRISIIFIKKIRKLKKRL